MVGDEGEDGADGVGDGHFLRGVDLETGEYGVVVEDAYWCFDEFEVGDVFVVFEHSGVDVNGVFGYAEGVVYFVLLVLGVAGGGAEGAFANGYAHFGWVYHGVEAYVAFGAVWCVVSHFGAAVEFEELPVAAYYGVAEEGEVCVDGDVLVDGATGGGYGVVGVDVGHVYLVLSALVVDEGVVAVAGIFESTGYGDVGVAEGVACGVGADFDLGAFELVHLGALADHDDVACFEVDASVGDVDMCDILAAEGVGVAVVDGDWDEEG